MNAFANHESQLARVRAALGGITCAAFDAFIVDHLEGRLTAAQRKVFEAHIVACPACGLYLRQYQRTQRAASQDNAPPDAPSELIEAIMDSLGAADR